MYGTSMLVLSDQIIHQARSMTLKNIFAYIFNASIAFYECKSCCCCSSSSSSSYCCCCCCCDVFQICNILHCQMAHLLQMCSDGPFNTVQGTVVVLVVLYLFKAYYT